MSNTKQDRIIAECPEIKLEFFDSQWDSALIGYAERGGPGRYVLPVYGYQAMKALLKEKESNSKKIYALLHKTLSDPMPGRRPLVLTSCGGKALWKRISNMAYPRWEHLDKAIIGIGGSGFSQNGVCYNKSKCIEELRRITTPICENEIQEWLRLNKLIETIVHSSLGENTPWFITSVK